MIFPAWCCGGGPAPGTVLFFLILSLAGFIGLFLAPPFLSIQAHDRRSQIRAWVALILHLGSWWFAAPTLWYAFGSPLVRGEFRPMFGEWLAAGLYLASSVIVLAMFRSTVRRRRKSERPSAPGAPGRRGLADSMNPYAVRGVTGILRT